MLHEINVAVLIVAALLLVLGAASGLVNNRLWLSEPILCALVGVIVGPIGFGWIDETTRRPGAATATVEAARFALAVAVVGAALRLPAGRQRG